MGELRTKKRNQDKIDNNKPHKADIIRGKECVMNTKNKKKLKIRSIDRE